MKLTKTAWIGLTTDLNHLISAPYVDVSMLWIQVVVSLNGLQTCIKKDSDFGLSYQVTTILLMPCEIKRVLALSFSTWFDSMNVGNWTWISAHACSPLLQIPGHVPGNTQIDPLNSVSTLKLIK